MTHLYFASTATQFLTRPPIGNLITPPPIGTSLFKSAAAAHRSLSRWGIGCAWSSQWISDPAERRSCTKGSDAV